MNLLRFPRITYVLLLLGLGAFLTVHLATAQLPSDSPASNNDSEAAQQPENQQSENLTVAKLGVVDPETQSVEPFVKPSEAELRGRLSDLEYNVTQRASTERAFSHPLWNNKKTGVYECVVCGQDLFHSETKYRSGTGWPSFYAPISENQVATKTDFLIGYPRTEVHCSRCQAHLGHVFNDGPRPTGKRYCMNGASLQFIEAGKETPVATEGADSSGPRSKTND